MGQLIRAFLAVPLPPAVRRQAGMLQQELAGVNPFKISWTAAQNLHITLKFLGETDPGNLHKARQALHEISFPPFVISFGGIGCFPKPASARVVYWEVVEAAGLVQLHQAIEARLKPLGFARERRAFKPHLTLGRIRERPQPLQDIPVAPRPEPISVTCFHLMRSELDPAGSRYSVLETYAAQG